MREQRQEIEDIVLGKQIAADHAETLRLIASAPSGDELSFDFNV
jgi:hypothetical protein